MVMASTVLPLECPLDTASTQPDEREWWLGNGVGGYAGGTIGGALTRRYHGLLVAPLHPPLRRTLLLAKADAELIDGETCTPLHSNIWRDGIVAPQGHRHLHRFWLDGQMPVWDFVVDDLRIEQRLWMDHGRNQTRIAFRWRSGERLTVPVLRLGLIASYRDHHAVNQPRGFKINTEAFSGGLRLNLADGHFVEVRAAQGRFTIDATWIENFFLARERERGLEEIDHHLRVGQVDIALSRDRWVGISVALGTLQMPDLATSLAAERARVEALSTKALPGIAGGTAPAWVDRLVLAADAYLFQRQALDGSQSASIIAGYPWFGDWGRDTMIALPGLALATGRPHLAREILGTFAGFVSKGMLPNVFPGDGEKPQYNTVDAALWFIEAWRGYVAATDDIDALRGVFAVLTEIVHAYRDGTRYGIGMDPHDGLVRAGVPGQQLTWMDARVAGREITPRHGKPVEINALWFNALRSMAGFARRLGETPAVFETLADKAGEGFVRFWRGNNAGLHDVLDGPDGNDAAIRPNQIFAVSLTHSPLTSDTVRRAVVDECRTHLLTPFGLRSLAPGDPAYRGHYAGGVAERDAAYHQGVVWGWLLGHYALAESRVTGLKRLALQRLEAIAGNLCQAGLGHLSEIFDGDAPYAPRGAPAQAWSVACTLEAWWRLTGKQERQT
jgi:predicted glycogen debranching enzyme